MFSKLAHQWAGPLVHGSAPTRGVGGFAFPLFLQCSTAYVKIWKRTSFILYQSIEPKGWLLTLNHFQWNAFFEKINYYINHMISEIDIDVQHFLRILTFYCYLGTIDETFLIAWKMVKMIRFYLLATSNCILKILTPKTGTGRALILVKRNCGGLFEYITA